MSNQQDFIALIKRISGQANVLAIPRVYIQLTGSIASGLFLSQCVYWSDRTSNKEGWFYKSTSDWQDEIGLTRREIDTARDACKGFIETKLKRAEGSPTLHYRVDLDKLAEALLALLSNANAQNAKTELPETPNPIVQNEQNINIDQNIDYTESHPEEIPQPEPIILAESAKPKILPAPIIDLNKPDMLDGMLAYAKQANTTGNGSIAAAIRDKFSINLIEGRRETRDFLHWASGEKDFFVKLDSFAAWWKTKDWRGKKGEPPTLDDIIKLWPQAASQQLSGEIELNAIDVAAERKARWDKIAQDRASKPKPASAGL